MAELSHPKEPQAGTESVALWPNATGPDADAYVTARLDAAAGLNVAGQAPRKNLGTPPGFPSRSSTTLMQPAAQLRSRWTVTGRPDSSEKGTCAISRLFSYSQFPSHLTVKVCFIKILQALKNGQVILYLELTKQANTLKSLSAAGTVIPSCGVSRAPSDSSASATGHPACAAVTAAKPTDLRSSQASSASLKTDKDSPANLQPATQSRKPTALSALALEIAEMRVLLAPSPGPADADKPHRGSDALNVTKRLSLAAQCESTPPQAQAVIPEAQHATAEDVQAAGHPLQTPVLQLGQKHATDSLSLASSQQSTPRQQAQASICSHTGQHAGTLYTQTKALQPSHKLAAFATSQTAAKAPSISQPVNLHDWGTTSPVKHLEVLSVHGFETKHNWQQQQQQHKVLIAVPVLAPSLPKEDWLANGLKPLPTPSRPDTKSTLYAKHCAMHGRVFSDLDADDDDEDEKIKVPGVRTTSAGQWMFDMDDIEGKLAVTAKWSSSRVCCVERS